MSYAFMFSVGEPLKYIFYTFRVIIPQVNSYLFKIKVVTILWAFPQTNYKRIRHIHIYITKLVILCMEGCK